MSKATVVNNPKLVMFTLSTGGDQGEKTFAPFFNEEDAIRATILEIIGEWGDEIVDIFGDISFKAKLMSVLKCNIKFEDTDKDGRQIYIFNGSRFLPREWQDKLSSNWWWLTKHIVDIPSNMEIEA